MTKNVEALAEAGEEHLRNFARAKIYEVERTMIGSSSLSKPLCTAVKVYQVFTQASQEEYGLTFPEENAILRKVLIEGGYSPQEFGF